MSNIQDVYRSIANMEVGSIKSRNVDKVSLAIRKGSLPLRLLLPSTTGEMEFIAIGNLQKMGWAIRDLCLFAPLGKGSGVQQFSKAMIDYLDLYMKAIKSNRSPATNCTIVGVEVQMGPIPWGAEDYWAIDITLTIEEIL